MCQFLVYHKVIQLYIYIYSFFFRFFSHIGYHRILSRVPCVIQQVLIGYLSYIQQCVYVNPKLPIYPSPQSFPFGNHKVIFDICKSVSVLQKKSTLFYLHNIFFSGKTITRDSSSAISRDWKQVVRGRRGALTAKRYEETFQEDGDILYHNNDKKYKFVHICQNSPNCILKID